MIPFWAILLTYAAGGLVCLPLATRYVLNDLDEGVGLDTTDRALAVLLGFMAASLWPLVAIGYVAYRNLGHLRSDREIREAEQAELRRLRAQAREYGLPMGDE